MRLIDSAPLSFNRISRPRDYLSNTDQNKAERIEFLRAYREMETTGAQTIYYDETNWQLGPIR